MGEGEGEGEGDDGDDDNGDGDGDGDDIGDACKWSPISDRTDLAFDSEVWATVCDQLLRTGV